MQYELSSEDIIAAFTAYAKEKGFPYEHLRCTIKTSRKGDGKSRAIITVGEPTPAATADNPVESVVAAPMMEPVMQYPTESVMQSPVDTNTMPILFEPVEVAKSDEPVVLAEPTEPAKEITSFKKLFG